MNRKLIEALRELEKEKGIKMDTIIEALKGALSASYKKIYDADYRVRIDIDEKSGEIKVDVDLVNEAALSTILLPV